jgi:hypothetical protein
MIFRIIAFATVAAAASALGFMWLDTQPPTVVLKMEILNEPVRPGGELKIKYTVYRLRSCETSIDRLLFDHEKQRVILEDLTFNGAPGPLGESNYVAQVPIPRSFATGPATYRVVSRYVCNPLQRIWPIVTINPDVNFEVAGEPLPNTIAPIETLPRR